MIRDVIFIKKEYVYLFFSLQILIFISYLLKFLIFCIRRYFDSRKYYKITREDKEKFVYIIAVIVRQRFHQDIDRKIPVKRRNSHALPITCPKKCLDSIHTVLFAFLLPRYDPILEYTAYTSSITAIFSYPYSVRSSGIW